MLAKEAVHPDRLSELEDLTRETFLLWDEVRVGFSWRWYYMNHTLRVRANALAMAKEVGADTDVLAYAATLHDITKRYDGPYKVDETGRRVVNEDGLWVNEPLAPARENEVTRLYHRLNLYYKVHHDSGAEVARHLLRDRGFSDAFSDQVAHVIRGHLRPVNPPWTLGGPDDPYGDPESCLLYDADTTDANLGAVAFYRNVQIHGHRAIQKEGRLDLYQYVDAIRDWVARKEEFVHSRITAIGKEVAAKRHEADRRILEWLEEERRDAESMTVAREFGLMGLIEFFLSRVDDPNMNAELDEVEREWLPERRSRAGDSGRALEALARAEAFVAMLRGEMEGKIDA